MRGSLQIMIIAITIMVLPAFADNVTGCGPGYGNRALECVAGDRSDETDETLGQSVRKVGECARIKKLLASPKMRELMMREAESERIVWWYAGNCPLGKSKG